MSTSENAIAGVFVQEYDARQEHVIYYVNQNLSGPPLRYSHEDNMALNVIFSIQMI